ncbi:MAG: alanine racemase [Lachnospiraceae bacterium]|nr:alanine racemase [Lachnospiraceae bacterium]
MKQRSTWAEVSIDQVRRNISIIKDQFKDLKKQPKLCGIVKADAYGHGLKGFVRLLAENRLVDCVAVGKISELRKLMEIKLPPGFEILLLGNATAEEIEADIKGRILDPGRVIFSIYNKEQFVNINRVAVNCGAQVKAHLRVDVWNSGMGMGPDELKEFEGEMFTASNLKLTGIYSHLYTSYSEDLPVIKNELEMFKAVVDGLKPENRAGLTAHILNSALIFKFPEYAFDMVRAGSSMYGLPCGDEGKLTPLMRVCANVFDVRVVPGTVPLSYEGNDTRNRDRKIARIMFGYWDSPLLLTQKDIRISINGHLFKPADEICMDNLCIDVTGDESVKVGDTAVLMGEEDGVRLMDILNRNNIHYVHSEWMCMTATRLEKVYL